MEKNNTKTKSLKKKIINSARFMACSSSKFVNKLTEEIHKYGHNNKKCKVCVIKYKESECCFEETNTKDDLAVYKCLCCNRNYQKSIMKT